ncbi:MAG: kinase-like domain-containing protein [Piptocephalis tieghemiana]|nr:MAG: kinase-like domain-containing protein [Piptocephalis tieghemiana]
MPTDPQGSGLIVRAPRYVSLPQPHPRARQDPLLPFEYRQENWAVVLRNTSTGNVVRYNPDRGQFMANAQAIAETEEERRYGRISRMTSCPYCNRPFSDQFMTGSSESFMDREDGSPESSHRSWNLAEGDQAIPSYFRLLADTYRGGEEGGGLGIQEDQTRGEGLGRRSGLSTQSFNQGYYARFFKEERPLGRGYRGSVFLCQHILDSVPLGQYAIKKVAIGDNHIWLVRMLREIDLLERLRHRHVIEYKHVWIEAHQLSRFAPEVPCLFILMEFANGGNLEEFVEKRKEGLTHSERGYRGRESPGLLTLEEVKGFMSDICSGLQHLHSHGVIHRDLKPGNVLLSYDHSGECQRPRAMLTDFGEGVIASAAGKSTASNVSVEEGGGEDTLGTPEYMPPELVAPDGSRRRIKQSVDLWSLGVSFYYLCFSRLPWSQVDEVDALIQEILEFKGWSEGEPIVHGTRDIPETWKEILQGLVSLIPSTRLSIAESLRLLHVPIDLREEEKVHGTALQPKRHQWPLVLLALCAYVRWYR